MQQQMVPNVHIVKKPPVYLKSCCTTLKLAMKVSLGDTKNMLKQNQNCTKGAKVI